MTAIHDKIRRCDTLPTLPAAALRVLQLTSHEELDTIELANVIAQDSALSGKILKSVNSPFYGLGQKVSNISQAVTLLGVHSVKTLVLGFSLVNTLRANRGGGFNHSNYWRRSMYAAAAARVLASKVLSFRQEECFISALLMDIGTLVLDQILGEQYDMIVERAKTHQELAVVEAHELGITHAEAGSMLAKSWSLPDQLTTPIAAHHGPQEVQDPELRKITQVVWLADKCADIFVNTREAAEAITTVRRSLREMYQMDDVKCDTMLCTIGQKTSELASMLEVRVNTTASYDQILQTATQRLLEMSVAAEDVEPQNKRKNRRVRTNGMVFITPCDRGILQKQLSVKLRDLSAAGIGVTHTERLEPGSQFIIQIPEKSGATKTLLYAVRRCDTYGGLSSIGAELTSVLRPELARQSPDTVTAPPEAA